jgi:predicted RecA/RadA family phage recombinase
MGLATFVHDGNAIDYTPDVPLYAGDVVVQGTLVGVARTPIAVMQPGSLAVVGVFDFPKAAGAGTEIAVGTELYWDVAEQVAKADSETGANKRIGKAVAAAATTATTVRVRMSQ